MSSTHDAVVVSTLGSTLVLGVLVGSSDGELCFTGQGLFYAKNIAEGGIVPRNRGVSRK